MPNAINLYRLGRFFLRKKLVLLGRIVEVLIFLIYNSRIPSSAILGKGTFFAYGGIGVVIHKRVVIGKNVNIGTNVTIGGRGGKFEVPVIGDNVFIATGAKILGPIKIGDNVTVGANAVVITDVPNNCVVAGVPAKIIRHENT